MNRPRFEIYAQDYLAPVLKPGDIVLADRLQAHLSPKVRVAIEATGAQYHLLPPYSPDFAPVEEGGSKIKQALRTTAARTVPDVFDAMESALLQVTPQDAAGWFWHKGYIDRPAHLLPCRPGRAQEHRPWSGPSRGRTSNLQSARDPPPHDLKRNV
jgi:transposase